MSFRIGKRVVCIDDRWQRTNGVPSHGPKLREVCVVAGKAQWDGDLFLFIEGYNSEEAYWAEAFRPVADTNISIFTAMLNRAPSVPADRELVP